MSYKVGTVCIGQNFMFALKYNGAECVIIEPVKRIVSLSESGHEYRDIYVVRWADGTKSGEEHGNLRPKWQDDEEQEIELKKKDRSKVSTLISTCKAEAEKALAKREKV